MDRPSDITAKASNLDINSNLVIGDFLQSVNSDFQYPWDMDWFDRIAELRKEQNMSRAELARRADVSYDVLNKIERGEVDQPRGDTLSKIAQALGTDEITLKYDGMAIAQMRDIASKAAHFGTESYEAQSLSILGKVSAGMWLEASLFQTDEPTPSDFRPNARYPAGAQYLLQVDGESLNKIAQHGDFILCVDYGLSALEIKSGDLAVIERSRDGGQTFERTAKRVVDNDGEIELRPESTDPRFQEPIFFDEHSEEATEVRIIAKIVQVLRDIE